MRGSPELIGETCLYWTTFWSSCANDKGIFQSFGRSKIIIQLEIGICGSDVAWDKGPNGSGQVAMAEQGHENRDEGTNEYDGHEVPQSKD
mmetsp:Transcript_4165/g.14948  ORF Transcript_4165/g.14948 Transcript_4165/m.14948 type:complete len:90 (+) Transcript_4165:2935-3204(+)